MSPRELPERASLEYLKKLAKERLRELRGTEPGARLAGAQLAVAREYGFPSWRALKAEVERRRAPKLEAFFTACAAGDVATIGAMLDAEPGLARESYRGTTGLHRAVRHAEAVGFLLEHGADPNARDTGDHALPLHFAAGDGALESVRALLDAGSEVQGSGDLHRLDTIGWACCFNEPHRAVVDLLVERGARHHVFSAIALGDVALVRQVVVGEPEALGRRLSRFEQEQTALHYVIAPPDGLLGGTFRTGEHYRTLDLLIELGADLEAPDAKGRTPLAVAMLRGDREAMQRLQAAGARLPRPATAPDRDAIAALARSIDQLTPMLGVADLEATVSWYRAIGFELTGSHSEDGRMDWACVTLGRAELMFQPRDESQRAPTKGVSLWFRTNRLDELYGLFKQSQLERTRAMLAGEATEAPEVQFTGDLYTAFYGQREFSIRDPDGFELNFYQPLE